MSLNTDFVGIFTGAELTATQAANALADAINDNGLGSFGDGTIQVASGDVSIGAAGSPVAGKRLAIFDGASAGNEGLIQFDASAVSSGYTASFTLNNTGLIIGHNSSSRTVELQVNSATRLAVLTTGAVRVTAPSSVGAFEVEANVAGFAGHFFNDGNLADRVGVTIQCGKDAPSVTGDVVWVDLEDGDGTNVAVIQYLSSTPFAQFAAASDERLKENIAPTQVRGLELVNALHLVEYDWKDKRRPRQAIGYLAQEAARVYPPMVSTGEDGMLMLGDACLMPILVKAVQELSAELAAVRAQLDRQGGPFL